MRLLSIAPNLEPHREAARETRRSSLLPGVSALSSRTAKDDAVLILLPSYNQSSPRVTLLHLRRRHRVLFFVSCHHPTARRKTAPSLSPRLSPSPAPRLVPQTHASLFGVGAPEALVIGVVALLVFGPKGLADIAKQLGSTLRAFQPTIRELQEVGFSSFDRTHSCLLVSRTARFLWLSDGPAQPRCRDSAGGYSYFCQTLLHRLMKAGGVMLLVRTASVKIVPAISTTSLVCSSRVTPFVAIT